MAEDQSVEHHRAGQAAGDSRPDRAGSLRPGLRTSQRARQDARDRAGDGALARVARVARVDLPPGGGCRLEPKKKPRSAWRRFVYPAPNACWQLEATEYVLTGGRKCVIFQLIDDHSRYTGASHVAWSETEAAIIGRWPRTVFPSGCCPTAGSRSTPHGVGGHREGRGPSPQADLPQRGRQQASSTRAGARRAARRHHGQEAGQQRVLHGGRSPLPSRWKVRLRGGLRHRQG